MPGGGKVTNKLEGNELTKQFGIGVKIYGSGEYEGHLEELIEILRETGVNTVFAGGGCSKEFRRLCKQNHIAFFYIISTFGDPSAVAQDPTLLVINQDGETPQPEEKHYEVSVNPTREDYRARKLREIERVIAELQPDGLSLDGVRWYGFWEGVRPDQTSDSIDKYGFSDHSLEKFQQYTQTKIPAQLQTTPEKAIWILEKHKKEWTEWKCEVITSMVRDIRQMAKQINPEILIAIHAVPWRRTDYDDAVRVVLGQDFQRLAPYVDIFSPMCYHAMLRREPQWIHQVVEEMYQLTQKPIWPCVQGKEIFDWEKPLTAEEFETALNQALRAPAAGINLFHWGFIQPNRCYEVFRRRCKGLMPGDAVEGR